MTSVASESSSLAALLAIGLTLHGCSSGSGGSDVRSEPQRAPTARVQILNAGPTGAFREGSEVLLTGKASEDADGPVIAWTWRQSAGPSVRLIEANSTTVSFSAPHVSVATRLTFQLTVEDSTNNTGSASVDVTVLPGRDSDKFLSLDVRAGPTFDAFVIVAALAGGASTGATAKPFKLSARAYLVYPPRTAPDADCSFESGDFAGGIPASLASGCLVAFLEDLTPQSLPDGGTGLAGQWPAGIDAPAESADARVSRGWNTRFSVPIPRLDVRAFNQRHVDSKQRDLLLDESVAHKARIALALSLTALENQRDATIILPGLLDAANDGAGLPTTALVPLETLLASIDGRELALTSEVYYRTVDPNNSRTTLNAWLRQAGFTSADGALLPAAVEGTGEFAHGVYLNNFDLGFGRQMHTRTDELGNVFSFVKNYATLEGAIRQLDSFVTVVMEYSPLSRHTDSTAKFAKFFTYVEDGSGDAPRVASFDFDGRGERFTPGNCVSCHGGARPPGVSELNFNAVCGDRAAAACYTWPARNRDGVAIGNGDLSATFLPWDIGSLLFADTDPAITEAPVRSNAVPLSVELQRSYGDFSRARQQAQLKKLNQAAYDTYDAASSSTVRALVEHWYGGIDSTGKLLSATFDDSTPVAGWKNDELVPDPVNVGATLRNPPTAADFYRTVYAQHCRMCHTSMTNETLRFDTYQELMAQETAIRESVFRTGVMPAARLTMDRFWSPFVAGTAAGDLFAAHLATRRPEEPVARPGPAVADIGGVDPKPNRGDTVYLDGSASAFAERYSWALEAPSGSAAALIGATGSQPAFTADRPGTYTVTLTVNEDTAAESTVTRRVDVANRMPVAANDLFSLDLVGSRVLRGSVLVGAHQDYDPDGDHLTVALSGEGAPAHGNVVVGADGSFAYTYTGTIPASSARDSFGYQIADGFGGTDRGTVTIILNDAPGAERPTPPASLSATDGSTPAGGSSVFRVELSWRASMDDVRVEGYNVYRDATLLAFVPSTAQPGTVVPYIDNTALASTTYVYRVTAVDAQNESAPSNESAVRVVSSLRRNIQSGWGAGVDSIWRVSGCIGCHRGAPGGLTLSGTPDAVFVELSEDANDVAPRRTAGATLLRSLLLCKPLIKTDPNSCAHEGGAFFVASDSRYQTLLRWIEDGTPNN